MLALNSVLPVYTLFLLVLIICGNSFLEILPCKFQNLLHNNMIMKYFFAFFTLIFFIVITIDEPVATHDFFIMSVLLFFLFIILVKNTFEFFIFNCILYFVIYMNTLIRLDVSTSTSNVVKEINNVLIILSFFTTLLGFYLNLKRKKKQYKDKFKFITFLFGEPKCKSRKKS